MFESAALEFRVPLPLLQAVGFVESRWSQLRPASRDLSEVGAMPPAYGVMGLRDDSWFGHSLLDAAALIGKPPATLRDDAAANIRGAAALMAELFRKQSSGRDPNDLLSWTEVLAQYSGIPQRDVQAEYVRGVFGVLASGYNANGISITKQQIDTVQVQAYLAQDFSLAKAFSALSDDYPPAEWDPSPNFNSRNGTPITHVIVHDTEGSFAGAVSWLKNPSSQVSAHFVIRSVDGYIKQLVREADRAWHVGCWNNWTIGIEHEGYVSQPQYFTEAMYQSSAALVRHLCDRYAIPKDRLHIVGHNVWQDPVLWPELGWDSCNTHTDPGQYWNWSYFLSLIVADSTPARILSVHPVGSSLDVPIYKTVSLAFDRTMDVLATQAAFSIDPVTPGSISWSADGQTLIFTPSSYLQNSTLYTIGLAGSAKSAGGGPLSDAPFASIFTTSPLDTVGPTVVRSFPRAGESGINSYMAFQYFFNEPVTFSSFSGRVRLIDVADLTKALGLGSVVYTDLRDGACLTFAPTSPLVPGHNYRMSFLPGIKDPLGNSTTAEMRTEFTTNPIADPSGGTALDRFEDNSSEWQQPWGTTGTNGVDSASTSFSISSVRKWEGTASGRLNYEFTVRSGGSVRLLPSFKPPLTLPTPWAGVWVYGDNSGNRLNLLADANGAEATVYSDTLDWFGWKFLSFDPSVLTSGQVAFSGLRVRQIAGADLGGTLYIDFLSQAGAVAVRSEAGYPRKSFTLYQNYPNPFNPSTAISFELERPEDVRLTVFNTLGQRVATLLDQRIEAGRHIFNFRGIRDDGTALPSGIYFYRLETRNGSELKAMTLIR